MAAGLFASLFAASSSSQASLPPAPTSKHTHSRQHSPHPSSSHHHDSQRAHTPSDDAEHHCSSTSDHGLHMLDADTTPSLPQSTSADPASPKEQLDVAHVHMQLSSPPSSPPPSAPAAPQPQLQPLARMHATTTQPSSSGSVKPRSSNSPSSTPLAEHRTSSSRPGSSSAPTAQRTSRRRMMPARLSQVSSLLAGSMLEEELLLSDQPSSPSTSFSPHNAFASSSKYNVPALPSSAASHTSHPPSHFKSFTSSSIIVLTSDTRLLARAVFPNVPSTPHATLSADVRIKSENQHSDLSCTNVSTCSNSQETAGYLKCPAMSSSSLVSTLAIKRQQLIETPDFKPRDDTLYMPKTRGLRSESAEDTSDAAYERRHRKPETAEKRQRKAEVDRLSRDRQKLIARIEQLKSVEPRMLQPIVVARDQVRAEACANNNDPAAPQDHLKPLLERIEDVRKELLVDAYETLKRYDLLLSNSNDAKIVSPAPSALPSKSDNTAERFTATPAEDLGARSQSPRLKIRIKGGRATWDTADSASPTPKHSPAPPDRSDTSRRTSARQPKQRVESLPTPLTAAAVEAVEDNRRKRRRLSGTNVDDRSSAHRKASTSHTHDTPTKDRATTSAVSPERRSRARGPCTGGHMHQGRSEASSGRSNGRPQRAAAAAAAVASARQRLQYAERSFSDFDYEDEDEDVESALDEADAPSDPATRDSTDRRPSHRLRRSSIKSRDHRSPSASSTSSSASSIASSLGYMYPTLPDTGSLKVSQSLAEVLASDPEATSSPVLTSATSAGLEASPSRGDGARKRLKVMLSRSPSASGTSDDAKRASSDVEQAGSRSLGSALTESEAESILAAFLGTTPIGKSNKAAIAAKSSESEIKAQSTVASAATSAPAPAYATATSNSNATLSKRRSARRNTTQSFGEKLPDLLTKTAQFDFSVMGYFRSIDRPAKTAEKEGEDG